MPTKKVTVIKAIDPGEKPVKKVTVIKAIDPAKVHLAIEGERPSDGGVFVFSKGDGTWVVHQITSNKLVISDYSHDRVRRPSTMCGEQCSLTMDGKVRTKATPDLAKDGHCPNWWLTNEPINCPECMEGAS